MASDRHRKLLGDLLGRKAKATNTPVEMPPPNETESNEQRVLKVMRECWRQSLEDERRRRKR